MTFLPTFMDTALAQALGWTLLHSLWQGSLIAVLMTICWRLLGDKAAQQRYLLSLLGLSAMLIWSGLTFVQTLKTERIEATSALTMGSPSVEIGLTQPGIALGDAHTTLSLWEYAQDQLHAYTPWIALAWAVGFALFVLRWVGAYAYTQGLRHRDATIMAGPWQNQLNQLAKRMGIRKTLLLIESSRISSPMTIGFYKPVVLVPLGLLAGMPAGQVEAILTHELAHIRRHDYLINLLVSLIETLFFFHPAVWWMGNRIREAREHCCDDLAIATSGDPMTYARALTELASASAPTLAPGLIGPRKHLLHRIKRIFVAPPQTQSQSRAVAAALTLFVLFMAGWFTPSPVDAAEPGPESLALIGATGEEIPWFYTAETEAVTPVAATTSLMAEWEGLRFPVTPIDSPPPVIIPPTPPTPTITPVPPPPPPPVPEVDENMSDAEQKELWKAYGEEMKQWEKEWAKVQQEGWKEYAESWEAWGESFAESMQNQDWSQWADSSNFSFKYKGDWNEETREKLQMEMEILRERLEMNAERMRDREEMRREELERRHESMQRQREELLELREELAHKETESSVEEVERAAAKIEAEAARIEEEVMRLEREAKQVEAEVAQEHAMRLQEEAMRLQEIAMKEAELAMEAEMMALKAFKENSDQNIDRLKEVLMKDGFIKKTSDKVTIKSKDGKLKINGTTLSGAKEKKYYELLNELGIEIGKGSTTVVRMN